MVDTLSSLLKNTYQDYELIVVDDGSDENGSIELHNYLSKKYVENSRVLFDKVERESKGQAYKKCVELAKGEYLLFWDATSVAKNNLIEKLVYGMNKSGCDSISCFTQDIIGVGLPTLMNVCENINLPVGASLELGLLENSMYSSALMMKRDAFIEISKFEEIYNDNAEMCMLVKLMMNHRCHEIVPDILAWNRIVSDDEDYAYNGNEYWKRRNVINAYLNEDNRFLKHFLLNWCMGRNEYGERSIIDKSIENKDEYGNIIERMEIEKDVLTKDKKELNDKIVVLSTELKSLNKDYYDLKEENRTKEAEIQQLRSAVDNYKNSSCWKITAPIRTILDCLKRKDKEQLL